MVRSLIQAVLSDPSGEVRCLAITGLSIYCVIELVNSFSKESGTVSSVSFTSMDNLFFESIIILLGMMRFQNRAVSIVAVEMINTLAEYCHLLLYRDAKLPSLVLLVSFAQFIIVQTVYVTFVIAYFNIKQFHCSQVLIIYLD